MLSYSDNVARRDGLAAAVIYLPEDYAALHGGNGDSYEDYLLRVESSLEEIEGPVRVVRVPFDPAAYRAWLAAGAGWRDCPEARAAWALSVAEDPAGLAALRKRCPVLPWPPVEEAVEVRVLYGVVAVLLEGESDVSALGRCLPRDLLEKAAEGLRGFLPPVPPFRVLSPLRAEGARVLVGDRLVHVGRMGEVEELAEDMVSSETGSVFAVPRALRCRRSDLGEQYPVIVAALLPVALHGAAGDVRYWDAFLAEHEGDIGPFSQAAVEAVAAVFGKRVVAGHVHLLPGYLVDVFLDTFFENLELSAGEEEEEPPPKRRARRNGFLRRVK